MLAYKVVGKNTRHCSNWAIFKSMYDYQKKEYEKFRKKNIEYFPRYLKNTTVKMAKGSAGILCFKNKTYAKLFLYRGSINIYFKIIKVKGYGKLKNSLLVSGCASDPTEILLNRAKMVPPEGTIAFEKVKVLE